jgi:hypothetical protein
MHRTDRLEHEHEHSDQVMEVLPKGRRSHANTKFYRTETDRQDVKNYPLKKVTAKHGHISPACRILVY